MKATLSMPVSSLVQILREGVELPSVANVAADAHLALAIDLYAASLSTMTSAARVIGLSTTVEALLQPAAVPPPVSAHIDALLQDLESRRDRKQECPEQRAAFNRLQSRLADLKNESISQRLRRLVISHAEPLGETKEEAARKMGGAYSVRSDLLHAGHADTDAIRRAESWLQTAVPKILDALIARACELN